MKKPNICVVGSSNLDLIAKVPRLPRMGETLLGRYFHMSCGGKGANQAVIAAKLGARVTMITRLGRDYPGEIILKNYREMGVDTRYIFFDEESSSGVAPILVDDQGRNLLVYIPGANSKLSPEDARRAKDAIQAAEVLVCQLEVPLETTMEALRIASEGGVLTILNPAPARSLPEELLGLSDIIVPNETEAEIITGLPVETPEQIEAAAYRLREMGAGQTIITLGEKGVLLLDETGLALVPAEAAEAVDTTGAGDAFIGSLAYFLARGKKMDEAVKKANSIAAVSVAKVGTQVSFPHRREIAYLLD